jgi:hypothetical protein
MPLTKTGKEVLGKMREEYGDKKAKEVFYASINSNRSGSEDWHYKKANNEMTVLGHRTK